MPQLPFDLATVDWQTVGILSAIALLASIVGNVIALGNRLMGSILTAIFFAVFYVAWHYWLQGMVIPPTGGPSPT
jgi:hypothetical protein